LVPAGSDAGAITPPVTRVLESSGVAASAPAINVSRRVVIIDAQRTCAGRQSEISSSAK
jgi:peptide deformylase